MSISFVIKAAWTQGISMQPQYESGAFVVINRLSYVQSKPKRFDIVGIRMAGERVMVLKRILAFPGERVRIEGGQLFVNDQAIAEPYVKHNRLWNYREVEVDQGEYFVIGDNRGMDMADHVFGRVDKSRIVGKVFY